MEKNDSLLLNRLDELKNQKILKIFLSLANLYKKEKEKCAVDTDFNTFLMEQTNPQNKVFLRKFLSSVNTYCQSLEELRYYVNNINKILKAGTQNQYVLKTATSNADVDVYKKCLAILPEFSKFLYLFSKFIGSGYLKYDGTQLLNIVPQLDLLENLNQWEETVDGINVKTYDCIITQDGNIYLARWEHELLCYWLSLNNISLDNALRVYQNPTPPRTLSLSSLAPYNYHENSKKYINMYLTDCQARSLFEMFIKLSKGKKVYQGQTFEDIFCENSENLGAGIFDSRANLRYNALTLEDMAGAEIFYAKGCIERVRNRAREDKQNREAYKSFIEKAINDINTGNIINLDINK